MAAALVLYLAMRYQALGMWTRPAPPSLLDNPLAQAGLAGRLFGAVGVLGRYFRLLVEPWPLTIDYSYAQVLPGGGETALWAAAGAAALAGWAWAAWRWRREAPEAGFGLALFAAGWFPVSHLALPIGTVMAESIHNFFQNAQNQNIIRELKSLGLNVRSTIETESHAAFADKTFVITGTLKRLSRDEAHEAIRRYGGKAA